MVIIRAQEKDCHNISGFLIWIYGCTYFSPCGWDNEKKISILYENMTSMKPEDLYEDVIVKPVVRKVHNLQNYISNVGLLRSNLYVQFIQLITE